MNDFISFYFIYEVIQVIETNLFLISSFTSKTWIPWNISLLDITFCQYFHVQVATDQNESTNYRL